MARPLQLIFNLSLTSNIVHSAWKRAFVTPVFESKGGLSGASNYRSIAITVAASKVLEKILVAYVVNYCEKHGLFDRNQFDFRLKRSTVHQLAIITDEWLSAVNDHSAIEFIPEEQHGFVGGRSTMSAVGELMAGVEGAWMAGGQPIYRVFVDFRAAFDRASREAIAHIVDGLVAGRRLRSLVREVLREDLVTVVDGDRVMGSITQTTGVAQGDCLSPLLFVLLLGGFPRELREEVRSVRVVCYADDVVLFGKHRQAVQIALRTLEKFCVGKGLVINREKTVAVKFRRGGRVAKDDRFWIGGSEIRMEREVAYLGVHFSCCGSFEGHIRERSRRAKVAISRIRKPHLLSTATALEVFGLCIAPVAAYGIAVVWDQMSERLLRILESVKATFLKRCLGVGYGTRNRVVYGLVGTTSFVTDLLASYRLPRSAAVDQYLLEFSRRVGDAMAAEEIRRSPAMKTEKWREAGREGRSLIMRVSIHGLHGTFCDRNRKGKTCFEETDYCVCKFCGEACAQFHIWGCKAEEGERERDRVRRAENARESYVNLYERTT